MTTKIKVVYTDNSIVDFTDHTNKKIEECAEDFLSQIKENNDMIFFGNPCRSMIINFAHVKHIQFDPDECEFPELEKSVKS